jgi:hypothetical protein
MAAEDIFGPDVGSLKGKTVRRSAEHIEGQIVNVPAEIMSRYREVILGGDIMFVNKIPFFMTVSRYIKFGTVEALQDQTAKTILGAIKKVKSVYMKRGFKISVLLMDGQFETLRGDLADIQITLNTVSNDEHVPEIERYIRTTKERMRCVYNMLPFRKIPARLIIELAYHSVFWLNCFPPDDNISSTLSPRAIVVGHHVDYRRHCKLLFGTYVQTHEEHDNSMASRTTGALALRPTGNEQGGHYFFSLSTGRILNRNRWTALPMPAEIIDRVHTLARRQAADPGLLFTDRTGTPLVDPEDDDSDDESYQYASEQDDDEDLVLDDDADGPIAGVYANENNEVEDANNANEELANDELANENDEVHEEPNENDEVHEEPVDEPTEEEHEEPIEPVDDENNTADEVIPAITLEQEMDARYGARTGHYGLRPRRPRDHSHIHTILGETVMTQHSLKKGIKAFGNAGIEAVLKELQQLHDRKVLEPKNAATLTQDEKRAALQYLMFLKQKRNGTIKGRGCADGRKQRDYTTKEEASSPTVAVEALLLSCVIDAQENRDVATADIPGAFMQADMEDVVHMKLEGTMAELLIKIDPALYRKHVIMEKGKQVLYVELRKALYGTLKAALLFWKKLTGVLTQWGFDVNPYDWCVANKVINDKQCTIVWHVDDLKISHVDPRGGVTDIGTVEG